MSIKFVLVHPQLPNNIGFVMRSSLNFAINDIAIVSPLLANFTKLLNNTDAGALENINLQICTSIEEAIKDCNTIIALSARSRSINKPVMELSGLFNSLQKNNNIDVKNAKIAVLFGAEQSGLSNEHLKHAQYIVSISNNKDFSSLNLSHAVALVAYEYFNFVNNQSDSKLLNKNLANIEDTNFMLEDLINKLEVNNYFSQPTRKPITISNLFNIYKKAHLTKQEVKTLVGIHKMLFGKK